MRNDGWRCNHGYTGSASRELVNRTTSGLNRPTVHIQPIHSHGNLTAVFAVHHIGCNRKSFENAPNGSLRSGTPMFASRRLKSPSVQMLVTANCSWPARANPSSSLSVMTSAPNTFVEVQTVRIRIYCCRRFLAKRSRTFSMASSVALTAVSIE